MKRVITLLAFIYILALTYLYFWQDKLIFLNSYSKGYSPRNVKVIKFKTSDGIVLEGGYLEHKKGLPLVLYFGGNAANVLYFLDDRAQEIKNYNFIAFNYPGYGNSEGKPSEKTILKYALEIAKKYRPQKIIGRSLGSAVASYVASKIEVDTLLIITPFDSIENVAQNSYPIFPIKLLIKHKFQELKWLKSSKAKEINAIFVKKDEIIPKKSIAHLRNSMKFNKVVILDATHNYIYDYKDIARQIESLLK